MIYEKGKLSLLTSGNFVCPSSLCDCSNLENMSLASLHDTITALSTPPGRSAIASIRVTGEDAIRIVAKVINTPDKLFSALSGSSVYTNLLDSSNIIIDDCLVAVYREPNSFTGEDVVEIFPHGSTVITDIILERLVSLGARLAEPGEFSRRALMHGKMGLEELEEVNLRVDAASPHQLERAKQMVQAKYTRLRAVYDKLSEFSLSHDGILASRNLRSGRPYCRTLGFVEHPKV